jgi:hypothetical protein
VIRARTETALIWLVVVSHVVVVAIAKVVAVIVSAVSAIAISIVVAEVVVLHWTAWIALTA